jgi:hypothetical protein
MAWARRASGRVCCLQPSSIGEVHSAGLIHPHVRMHKQHCSTGTAIGRVHGKELQRASPCAGCLACLYSLYC